MEPISLQPAAADSIQAEISGQNQGQVAVGKYITQIGSVHGGTVIFNPPDQRPQLSARPGPVKILPRRAAGMLDRTQEVEAAASALAEAVPVEYHAPEGMGKSSLLRHLARQPITTAFPDGVIYLSAHKKGYSDLLQSIFEAFFEYDQIYKPSDVETRLALQSVRALILLDDVELSRDEVEALLDAAPDCTFLLAGPNRKLWGDGLSRALSGLPLQEARQLLERELGRPLLEEEAAMVDDFLAALEGSPLAIIQAAALVREHGYPLKSLAAVEEEEKSERKIAAFFLGLLAEQERKAVASLAALDGAPLNASHLPALMGTPDAEPLLRRMQKRGLVKPEGGGYSLAGGFAAFVREAWDLTEWREGLADYFSRGMGSGIREPRSLLNDAEAILNLIDWASQSGRWGKALELVRAVEGRLALGLRWGAWERVLQRGLEAAGALGDLSAKAWSLHQLGTRALVLGEGSAARQALIQALRIRLSQGDLAGAAATRHNLNLLLEPPGNGGDPPPRPPGDPPGTLRKLARAALTKEAIFGVILPAALVAGLITFWLPGQATRNTPTPTSTVTAVAASLTPVPSSTVTTWVAAASETPTTTGTTTATETSTPTATEAPTETPTPSATPCMPRADWPVYVVQRGDTLSSIARATGASVRELIEANCLTSSLIIVGQELRVPRLPPPTATATATQTATFTPTVRAPELPDLVVSLKPGSPGPLFIEGELVYISIPLAVNVTNIGLGEAGPFHTAIYYRGGESDPSQGGRSGFRPLILSIEGGLGPGQGSSVQVSLEAAVPLGSQTVEIWAIVDDCAVSGLTGHCAVLESDENNNRSAVEKINLPGNQEPSVWILSHEAAETIVPIDYFGMESGEVVLEGQGWDPEEGYLGGEQLFWTTDRTDLQGSTLGWGERIKVRLYADVCEGTTHTITLTGGDSQGASSRDTRQIRLVGEYCGKIID
jgi:LysM repeat protein